MLSMMDVLTACNLCGRNCIADRRSGQVGYCGSTGSVKVSRAGLHMWEEPCISGSEGSGTVFFSGCSLGCVFCQNYAISGTRPGDIPGEELTIEELGRVFLKLQDMGANNINLVTPTHFIPQIKEALETVRPSALKIPILYNTGSYDSVQALKILDGLVDIYLPDLKYFSPEPASRYSNAPDYFNIASAAIEEMFRQIGPPVFDERGMMKKGVVVRHMMLPGCLSDSKKVLHYLYETYGNDIYISIMSQYTPVRTFDDFPELNKKISRRDYDRLVDYAIKIGIENAFIQEEEAALESFIPDFYSWKKTEFLS